MKYVVALGGNAIRDYNSIDAAADTLAALYAKGNEIVVTHGNGPQVGELAEIEKRNLAILTAQTEAWIGMEIGNKIANALKKLNPKYGNSIPTVVLTEVIVNGSAKEMDNPTKPIGRFYTEKEAAELKKRGLTVKKLINGYRRVVPSPTPKEIVQKDVIERLLKDKRIVISCGGGGIPVTSSYGRLEYVDAVIDKDRASALLAKEIGADKFFILTNVDGVYLNFKKRNQEFVKRIKSKKLNDYLKSGQFEEGSMKPKIESCIDFAESTKRSAGIGNMANPNDVLSLKKLTIITP